MSNEISEPEDTGEIRNPDGTFKPGISGNPAGRPKGSLSIRDLVRQHLEDNPEDLAEFVKHFIKKNRELAWQMMEGKPQQDITSAGEKLIPTPIYGGKTIQGHVSDPQNLLTDKED